MSAEAACTDSANAETRAATCLGRSAASKRLLNVPHTAGIIVQLQPALVGNRGAAGVHPKAQRGVAVVQGSRVPTYNIGHLHFSLLVEQPCPTCRWAVAVSSCRPYWAGN